MGNHETRHDWPRSCRDVLSKKCQRVHKTRQNKKRSHKKRTRDLWNTRRESQIQTQLDQPSWKNGQHQTSETRPQLQTSRKKRSWMTWETMATRRCRNRSSDPIHGRRWWWLWFISSNALTYIVIKFMHLAIYITRLICKELVRFIHPIVQILARSNAVDVILIDDSVQSHRRVSLVKFLLLSRFFFR